MIKPFTLKQSRTLLTTRIFRIREDKAVHPTSGQTGNYYVIENPDWVNMICLTEKRELLLVRQWRHGIRSVELELPAGMIEQGESPLGTAARELLEETGYQATNWTLLGKTNPNAAYQSNTCFHAFAKGCRYVQKPSFDEGEDIELILVPLKQIPALLEQGVFRNSLGICAWFFWLQSNGCILWNE